MKPSFRPDGIITAGNASRLSDGASAVLLGSAAVADRIGRDPIARIAGRGTHVVQPHRFGHAPVEAANKALARAGIGWSDVGLVELNEAFAVQSLACVDAWLAQGLSDPEIVNTRGGAIALGPPRRVGRPDPQHPSCRDARGRPPVGRCRHLHRRRAGARGRPRERGRLVTTTHYTDPAEAWRTSPTARRCSSGGRARRPTHRAHRRTARARRKGPHRGQQQCRQRRPRARRTPGHRPGAQDHLLLPPVRTTPGSSTTSTAPAASTSKLSPQGNLAERMRAAGAGIGAFFSPIGVGTPLAEGKEQRIIGGRDYVLEHPIRGDYALIKAHHADRKGNLVYRKTARNFGPVMATAATTTIVQVTDVVQTGDLDPENVVTPSIFDHRVVHVTGATKPAEQGAAE